MIKKIFLSLICAALMPFTAFADDVKWTDVSTADEFVNAVKASSTAKIRLTGDIDLSNVKPSSDYIFSDTFKGKITSYVTKDSEDGGLGHSITGAKYSIFKKMDGAEVYEVRFENCTYAGLSDKTAVLAGECYNSNIHDVAFGNISAEGNLSIGDCARMAVVAGYAEKCYFTDLLFLDCSLITDGFKLGMVAGEANDCRFESCITNAGCSLWADGMSETVLDIIYTNAYTGGICGFANNCTLEKCYNFGAVSSDDNRIGGIIGYGFATTVTDCKNGGVVKHCTKVGFGREARQAAANSFLKVGLATGAFADVSFMILAPGGCTMLAKTKAAHSVFMRQSAYKWLAAMVKNPLLSFYYTTGAMMLTSSVGTGTTIASLTRAVVSKMPAIYITVSTACIGVYAVLKLYDVTTTPDEIGGIAGKVEGDCTLLRCTNSGPVECADEYGGGIAGYLDNASIEDCYNSSFVKGGTTDIGGIVGYCKNGVILRNLNVGVVTAKGTVLSSAHVGGIEGEISGKYNGKNNYFLADENKEYGEGVAYAFTQENLPSGTIAYNLNKASDEYVWRQDLGTDFYPVIDDESKPIVYGTTEKYSIVQKVSTAGEFYNAVAYPKAQVVLENDIDLNSFYFMLSTRTQPFCGTIDGNGYTLSNCTYESSSKDNLHKSDELGNNAALFPFANGATFKNLTLDGFHITQKHEDVISGAVVQQALLVGTSTGCTYNNVTLRNSDILLNADKNNKQQVAGLVAISNNDTFQDCTVESTCTFQGRSTTANTYVGGIVSQATGSKFTSCFNAATIWANDNYEGGIVAWAKNCTIDRCLNSGTITAQEYVAGIAGYVESTNITKCVNVGNIKDDENKKESYHAGIVGCMKTSGTISDCLNFGDVEYPGSKSGAIDGLHSDVTYGDGNNYYCQYDGTLYTNLTDAQYWDIKSGKYAFERDWLYQSLDNDPFCTIYPVPIADAGTVMLNILCDGKNTKSYSNHYQAESGHTCQAYAGICTLCGNRQMALSKDIHITNAKQLVAFSQAVNNGVDFSNSTICLDDDIDMEYIPDFEPIGKNAANAFKGTFTGNGHRIKNLNIKRTTDNAGTGLFGCVSGTSKITDLVIDSTCTVFAKHIGTAGIVGCLIAPTGSAEKVSLTLERCGNEGRITGCSSNVAGLVGGVYNSNTTELIIRDCYNIGTIIGQKESAAIVGYGGKNIEVSRSWNTGLVIGNDEKANMVRFDKDATTKFDNNFQWDALDSDNKAKTVTYDDFFYGKFADKINAIRAEVSNGTSATIWAQNLGTDATPQLANDEGIYHKRNTSSQWGTAVLPYAVSSNAEVQLYELVSSDIVEGKITVQPVSTVAPNVPFFFKKLDDNATSVCFAMGTQKFTYTDGDPESITKTTKAENWSIVGSYRKLTDIINVFFVAEDKLWNAEEAITVPAYHAYLTYYKPELDSEPLSICALDDKGEVDEIDVINADDDFKGNIYNLAGQRVNKNTKGIVIINGKKVLVK